MDRHLGLSPARAAAARAEQAWNARRLRASPRPAWRLWRYPQPALVLGAAQHALHEQADRAVLDVLRRRAGGGAVLVGPWMIGLSVALPASHPLAGNGLLCAYRWLGEALARALSFHGVQCEALAPRQLQGRPREPADWACFGSLSPWEVLCQGRKIAGLAQARTGDAVLLVAGVLLRPPHWELLCRALRQPETQARRLRQASIDWEQAAAGAAQAPAEVEQRIRARLRAELAASLRAARA